MIELRIKQSEHQLNVVQKSYLLRFASRVVVMHAGGDDARYTHTQTLPQSVWTINHQLGKHPNVSFRDSAGTVFVGAYEHVSDQLVIATFTNPVSGFADCN